MPERLNVIKAGKKKKNPTNNNVFFKQLLNLLALLIMQSHTVQH